MAAEIVVGSRRRAVVGSRFNEAAANGRGNLAASPATASRARRFNEAAANGRGNPERMTL